MGGDCALAVPGSRGGHHPGERGVGSSASPLTTHVRRGRHRARRPPRPRGRFVCLARGAHFSIQLPPLLQDPLAMKAGESREWPLPELQRVALCSSGGGRLAGAAPPTGTVRDHEGGSWPSRALCTSVAHSTRSTVNVRSRTTSSSAALPVRGHNVATRGSCPSWAHPEPGQRLRWPSAAQLVEAAWKANPLSL